MSALRGRAGDRRWVPIAVALVQGHALLLADAGARAAPARTTAIVSMIDSLVTTNSFAASALEGNAPGEMRFLDPRFPTVPGSIS
jgi:hypothetical protein